MIGLKRISLFEGNSPQSLQRQLLQLESNAADAVRRLDGAFLPVLAPTKKQTTNCTAVVGDMVVTDTSGGDITVTLPVATVKNAGRCVGVVRTSSLNALQVGAVSGTVTGAASESLPIQKRVYLYFSDGEGWWRTP